jgi:hypothetical protein
MSKNKKGRPTQLTVSVMDNRSNAIIYTGSIARFVAENFKYCNENTKKTAYGLMYQSMKTGCSAFDGKVRVFKNLESI